MERSMSVRDPADREEERLEEWLAHPELRDRLDDADRERVVAEATGVAERPGARGWGGVLRVFRFW